MTQKRKQKAICIKFSERDPRDLALWEMVKEQTAVGDINLSATIKELLREWYERGQVSGARLPMLPAPYSTNSAPSNPLMKTRKIQMIHWCSVLPLPASTSKYYQFTLKRGVDNEQRDL
jgi:hypothetical protein